MSRRHLAFIILLNSLISLVIAVAVVWIADLRRPDPEELTALNVPSAPRPWRRRSRPHVVRRRLHLRPAERACPRRRCRACAGGDAAGTTYTVQAGESLSAIAERYGVTLDDLIKANNLTNPNLVFSGQRLPSPPREAKWPAAQAHRHASVPSGGAGIQLSVISNPGSLADESVSLVNSGDLAVNLQGWRLEREGGPAYSFGSVPLLPGGGIIVYTRVGTDTSFELYWNQAQPVWPKRAPGLDCSTRKGRKSPA